MSHQSATFHQPDNDTDSVLDSSLDDEDIGELVFDSSPKSNGLTCKPDPVTNGVGSLSGPAKSPIEKKAIPRVLSLPAFAAAKEKLPLKSLPKVPSLPVFVPTKTKDEVPLLFREPYVEKGFRALDLPWYHYLLSILQLHNESMNVWTHLIACLLMANKLLHVNVQVDFINDPYTWPLLAGFICGMALYAFSSMAHCLQSKSELVHYTAFMVDYAGIGLYGLGSTIVHLAYCSEDSFFQVVNAFFVPVGAVLAFSICFCCSVAKVIYKRPYPFMRKIWQMGPVASIYVLLISPIAHRLFTCYWFGESCNESINYHIQQIFWFIASGAFFASDFPQRIRPGWFDHFFHSHQLFHICITICTLKQMDGVFIDLQTRQNIIHNRPVPTLLGAFGPVLMVMLAELVCIAIFRIWIKRRLLKAD